MSRASRLAGRAAALAALVAFAPPADVEAQCLGSASPVTAETLSTACSTLTGARPALSWTFEVQCLDDCGRSYRTIPTMSASARGTCNALPPFQVCVPFFDQKDHVSGLYAVTSARNQMLLAGCRPDSEAVHVTQANCPCAPLCESDDQPSPSYQPPLYGSPVLFSLDDGRYELTSAEDGVIFDIDANGTVERVAWTRAGSDEVFLALDRDGSGAIENGLELFGDGSPQLPSDELNGFRALALFDEPHNGGDGDGWIGPGDEIFRHLLLWRDLDHDGESNPAELTSAQEAGLAGIALDHRSTRRRDRHGNQFRYAAPSRWRDGVDRMAWDVFFVVLPP